MVKRKKKTFTKYYLDTESAYRNSPQNYGNRPYRQNSQFNNSRWENPNHPRRHGRYDLPVPRRNIEFYPESRYKKSFKKKKISRPPSPVVGSEEHMELKIKQTSAIIMRQLLSPDENIVTVASNPVNSEKELSENSTSSKTMKDKSSKVSAKKKKKKLVSASAEEIHDKIMSHLSNLNDGKKKNLINSSRSGYDDTLQRIVKQQRIEISRALRNMCGETSQVKESTDFINSIIPDIGIKIEDLPQDLLQELQSTFEIDSSRVEYFGTTMHTHNSSTSEVLLNLEMSYEEEPNQHQIQAQIPFAGELNTSDINNPPHNFPSGTDAAYLELDKFKEGCGSSVGLLATEVREVALREMNLQNRTENETPLVSAAATEVSEVIQSELDQPQINNDSELDISSVCISAGEVTQSEPNEVIGIFENVKKEDLKDFRVDNQHDMENSSDVEIIEDEQNSKIPTEVILSDDEENLLIPNNCDNDCPAVEAIEKNKEKLLIPDNCGNACLVSEATENESFSQSIIEHCSIASQTLAEDIPTVETFLQKRFPESLQGLQETVERMMVIDQFISELVKYRQGLYSQLLISARLPSSSQAISGEIEQARLENMGKTKNAANGIGINEGKNGDKNSSNKGLMDGSEKHTEKCGVREADGRIRCEETTNKEKIKVRDVRENNVNLTCVESNVNLNSRNYSGEAMEESPEESTPGKETLNNTEPLNVLGLLSEQNMLEFQEVKEKMLVIKVFDGILLAATETGKIFFCSLEDGHYTHVLEVTKVPITSLLSIKEDEGKTRLYVGSFENSLKMYNFHSQCLLKSISLPDSVQSMDENWGYIFLGCMRGTIMRYSIKKGIIEYEDKFSNDTIFVIKATKEGVQRVLLIGSRNAPVVIRAAMTCLHLRTMEKIFAPTVYSLIIEKNLVYCGTTNLNILVYNFHDGTLTRTLKATESKGIGCLKIVGKLLFASCHNGRIYVYNIETNKFIDSIAGPGGVILSMEVLENQVVVGTMSFKFASIPIPRQILEQRY